MCESKIFIEENGSLRQVADEIIYIKKNGSFIEAYTVEGDTIRFKDYDIKYIDFMSSKVVLIKASSH